MLSRVASWSQGSSFESVPAWRSFESAPDLCVVSVVLNKTRFKTECTATWHLCVTLVV